jgi:hypothetical protein
MRENRRLMLDLSQVITCALVVLGLKHSDYSMARILKIVWVLSAVGVLVTTLMTYSPGSRSDAGIFLVYGMLFLTFPSGWLVVGLVTGMAILQDRLGEPFLDALGSNHMGHVGLWCAFFTAGYFQWFLLIPFLRRKWNA